MEAGSAAPTARVGDWALLAILAYFGFSSLLPTLTLRTIASAVSFLVVCTLLFFGGLMVELRRMLVAVHRPTQSTFPVLSILSLSLPIVLQNLATGVPSIAGTATSVDSQALVDTGAFVSALLAATGTLSLVVLVGAPDQVQSLLLARVPEVLPEAGNPLPGDLATADAIAFAALSEPSTAAGPERRHGCPVCGKPVRGLDYHRHGLTRSPSAAAVGMAEDAYGRLDPSAREALLEHKAKGLRQNR